VFLATDAARQMKEAGMAPPASTSKGFTVMGEPFDPSKREEYAGSFAIRRG
jgi:nitrate/nitrite transport system substrate-binding protein